MKDYSYEYYQEMVERNTLAIKQSVDKIIGINKRHFEDKIVNELCLEIWADCINIEKRLDDKRERTKK